MQFYGLKDFYANRLLYKSFYICMSEEKKRLYKRFVYSISFENEYVKDVIWEYLNDEENSEENITRVYYQRTGGKRCQNIIVKKQLSTVLSLQVKEKH